MVQEYIYIGAVSNLVSKLFNLHANWPFYSQTGFQLISNCPSLFTKSIQFSYMNTNGFVRYLKLLIENLRLKVVGP